MTEQRETAGGSADPEPGAAILVVEDFAPLRVLVTRVLSTAGHHITAVETAEAARAAFEAAAFDLIVTDVAIPGGNGADVARAAVSRRPGVRVLFVSGSALGDLDLSVPGARTDFLQKPFDIDELLERVGGLLHADVG